MKAMPENATFHLFKPSGKWGYSGRGHLSARVFNVFTNVDRRAQILNDNSERMPGVSSNGDGYIVVIIADEDVEHGWPLLLNPIVP